MNSAEFDFWVKKILATEPVEISCSDCFDLLNGYVDAEQLGKLGVEHARVYQHLVQCKVCREEYELLRDLAQENG